MNSVLEGRKSGVVRVHCQVEIEFWREDGGEREREILHYYKLNKKLFLITEVTHAMWRYSETQVYKAEKFQSLPFPSHI
jgi:hypothetical protein